VSRRLPIAAAALLLLALQLWVLFDPALIEIDPEERYNAGVAQLLTEGQLDQLFAMQYRPFCGGCSVDSLLAAPLFLALGPSLLSYKLVPVLALVAYVVFALRRLAHRNDDALLLIFALLSLLPPRAFLHLSLIAWGNHLEAGLLAAVGLLLLRAGRPRPLLAGLAHGFAVYVGFSGAPFLLAAALGLALERRGRALGLLLLGAALGLSPWLAFLAETGQWPITSIYGEDDALPLLSRLPHKLGTLLRPRQIIALLGDPHGWPGALLGLTAALSLALAALHLALPDRWLPAALRPAPSAPPRPGRLGFGLLLAVGAWLGVYLLVRFQLGEPEAPHVAVPGSVRYAAPLYPHLLLILALSAAGLWRAAPPTGTARRWPRLLAIGLLLPVLLGGLRARVEARPRAPLWRQAAADWSQLRQQLAYALPLSRHTAPRTAAPELLHLHSYAAARELIGQRLRDPRRLPVGPLPVVDPAHRAAALEGLGEALAAHSQDEARPLAALLTDAAATLDRALPELSPADRRVALRAAASWRLPSAVDPALQLHDDQELPALSALIGPLSPELADALLYAAGRRRALALAAYHLPSALRPPLGEAPPAYWEGFGCGLGQRWGPQGGLPPIAGLAAADEAALLQGYAGCLWPDWLGAPRAAVAPVGVDGVDH